MGFVKAGMKQASADTPQSDISADRSIRVLVVGDHRLDRDCVSGMLSQEPDVHIVGVAESANDAIAKALGLRPDLVIIGTDTPVTSYLSVIQIIRSRLPKVKFLLVTACVRDQQLDDVLGVGVNGIISKKASMLELGDAVRNIAAGRTHFSPEVMTRMVVQGNEIHPEQPPTSRFRMLSQREQDLLRVLARGASLKEAAGVLGISYKTADKRKAALMAKLGIHSRVELARYAIREGLVEP
ncbi:MAG TPA: response regulator transcription factor [Phycisphaerae bacterium]|nr:response regulator transcription factor [Phycisphaerae bacterium]